MHGARIVHADGANAAWCYGFLIFLENRRHCWAESRRLAQIVYLPLLDPWLQRRTACLQQSKKSYI